jgi:NhaP-type Na+/H+ or K+/H+ antiporter
MHCFTLFLCQGGGVSGIYATFAAYRVLTFNKHIYGSQKIA